MIRQRELKMTLICVCGNQFGAWRPRCPACGTATPQKAEPAFNPPKRVERKARQDDCIFCQGRKAKERCPHCNEPIHRVCQRMHAPDCQQFQVEREAALAAVNA